MAGNKKAFTLVEILIVVVILAVLAAIVIPQFTNASADSNTTTLKGNLQTVRAQIQLYKVQHDDLLPGQAVIGGDVAEQDFKDALTTFDGSYGPYLQRFPKNLYISDPAASDSVTCVNDPLAAPTGNEGTGWWFNVANVDFRACDSAENIIY